MLYQQFLEIQLFEVFLANFVQRIFERILYQGLEDLGFICSLYMGEY